MLLVIILLMFYKIYKQVFHEIKYSLVYFTHFKIKTI